MALLSSIVQAQSKTHAKMVKSTFYTEVEYHTECKDGGLITTWLKAPTYYDVEHNLQKWARNHKILSFKITTIAPITKDIEAFISAIKPIKFQCDNNPFTELGVSATLSNPITAFDTMTFTRNTLIIQSSGQTNPMLIVREPYDLKDTSLVYTVSFRRSKVKFINDSTFTFKLQP